MGPVSPVPSSSLLISGFLEDYGATTCLHKKLFRPLWRLILCNNSIRLWYYFNVSSQFLCLKLNPHWAEGTDYCWHLRSGLIIGGKSFTELEVGSPFTFLGSLFLSSFSFFSSASPPLAPSFAFPYWVMQEEGPHQMPILLLLDRPAAGIK